MPEAKMAVARRSVQLGFVYLAIYFDPVAAEPMVPLGRIIFVALLLTMTLTAGDLSAQAQEDSCATCHLALGIANLTKPAEDFKADIHAAKGFGCESPVMAATRALWAWRAWTAKKVTSASLRACAVVEVCGKCHPTRNFMRNTIRRCASIKWLSTTRRCTASG